LAVGLWCATLVLEAAQVLLFGRDVPGFTGVTHLVGHCKLSKRIYYKKKVKMHIHFNTKIKSYP
jgi:hypothetical protein